MQTIEKTQSANVGLHRCNPIPIIGLLTWLVPLFWIAQEYIGTKVTNDEYELFTYFPTSKCVVTFVTLPQANIIVTRDVSDLKM